MDKSSDKDPEFHKQKMCFGINQRFAEASPARKAAPAKRRNLCIKGKKPFAVYLSREKQQG